MASLAEDEFDIFRAEQLGRTIARAPWRNMVSCAAQYEHVASHLGQVERMIGNLECSGRCIGVGFEQFQEIAHQRRRQVGRIGIPEQDVECRGIITQQVIVDHIVPDQVIGPQPGKAPRKAGAFDHTLFLRPLPRERDAVVRYQRRRFGIARLGFEHAHHHGDGVGAGVTHRRQL